MNPEVSVFLEGLAQPWQTELSQQLRKMVHEAVPGIDERIQYKKPHFLKNGHYAAVISPSKDAIAFMIMNAKDVAFPADFEGPPERKWKKYRAGDTPDYELLAKLFVQASGTL